uniref:Uncharacterized protein n=1 Tax=Amphimedon queenslandica TaxID=400682 RepID=A0A1X7U7L1_AMPQE
RNNIFIKEKNPKSKIIIVTSPKFISMLKLMKL